jgi:predicted nucleotidyltransferase component of viral defense system
MSTLQRTWGSAYQLDDLLSEMPGGMEVAARDFALLTLVGHLSATFPRELVFKGGFVLRHVHGFLRFSSDADSTRHAPPLHKLDADEVAKAMREASVNDIVRFDPQAPATDSARSLDFDDVRISGSTIPSGRVQIEISYREGVVAEPASAYVGAPFYDPFEILVMTLPEMSAEKLRALAQRIRPTDLADLAKMLMREDVVDEDIARIAPHKFELVRQGNDNRVERIEQHLREMKADYDAVVPGLFPEAPPYVEAMDIVWPRIKKLIP